MKHKRSSKFLVGNALVIDNYIQQTLDTLKIDTPEKRNIFFQKIIKRRYKKNV
jgi:hypothetical protein